MSEQFTGTASLVIHVNPGVGVTFEIRDGEGKSILELVLTPAMLGEHLRLIGRAVAQFEGSASDKARLN